MGIFHPTCVSVSSEGKHNSGYMEFRPYCAISAPPLLPQKQRDAFLAKMVMQTKSASTTEPPDSLRCSNRALYMVLAVLPLLVIVRGVLWQLHIL